MISRSKIGMTMVALLLLAPIAIMPGEAGYTKIIGLIVGDAEWQANPIKDAYINNASRWNAVNTTVQGNLATWNATYNGTYAGTTNTVNANLANWNATYNFTYAGTTSTVNENLATWNNTYNSTYDATTNTVNSNLVGWNSTYNATYDAKEPAISAGSATQFLNGLKGWITPVIGNITGLQDTLNGMNASIPAVNLTGTIPNASLPSHLVDNLTGTNVLNTQYTTNANRSVMIFVTANFTANTTVGSQATIRAFTDTTPLSGIIGIESSLNASQYTGQLVFIVRANTAYAVNSTTSGDGVVTLGDWREILI